MSADSSGGPSAFPASRCRRINSTNPTIHGSWSGECEDKLHAPVGLCRDRPLTVTTPSGCGAPAVVTYRTPPPQLRLHLRFNRFLHVSCQAVRAWPCLATASITECCGPRQLRCLPCRRGTDCRRIRQQSQHLPAISNRHAARLPHVPVAAGDSRRSVIRDCRPQCGPSLRQEPRGFFEGVRSTRSTPSGRRASIRNWRSSASWIARGRAFRARRDLSLVSEWRIMWCTVWSGNSRDALYAGLPVGRRRTAKEDT
jgi:hypothetical protein